MMENSNLDSPSPGAAAAGGKGGPNMALIGAAIVAALGVVFFFQNGELTTIDFLVFEKRTTIRWSILMAVVLGIVLDRLFAIWWRRRGKKKT
jgi:uncharacterized integral membrane protein